MNEQILKILKSKITTHITVSVFSINAGLGLGYFIWGRKKTNIFSHMNEIKFDFDTEGLYDYNQNTEKPKQTLPRLLTMAPETTAHVTDDSVIIEAPKPNLVEVNIFEQENYDWDWETELNSRTDDAPYVIHHDEFYESQEDYTQSTLTYYQGDDIMCDENDVPIFDYQNLVGPLLFGHGSGDENVVLIRNDLRKGEYEIQLNFGRYEVEIMGLEYENSMEEKDLKHSKVSRFKTD